MKKTVFFYIITLLVTSFLAAAGTSKKPDAKTKTSEKKDYLSMRITPEVALMNGYVKEYVFSDFAKTKIMLKAVLTGM